MLRWVDEHAPDQLRRRGTRSTTRSSGPSSSAAGTTSASGRTRRSTGCATRSTPHAAFAVAQAMASPCLEIVHTAAVDLGGGTWRVEAGIANTGWLPTHVSARGAKDAADRSRSSPS